MNIRNVVAMAAMVLAGACDAWGRPAAAVKTGAPSLSCNVVDDVSPAERERRALRTAPEGARRTSAHVLTVIYKSGVQRFVDKKPYREELDGFHWSYCGYLPALGAHLVGMEQDSLFSGKLLLDRDGRLLDAGAAVYPSPDGRLFLAERQVNGEYLSHWVLSDMTGRQVWSGMSGVITETEAIRVEYENPRWIGADVIQVVAVCNDRGRTKGEATLARVGKTWRWRSSLQCKA